MLLGRYTLDLNKNINVIIHFRNSSLDTYGSLYRQTVLMKQCFVVHDRGTVRFFFFCFVVQFLLRSKVLQ